MNAPSTGAPAARQTIERLYRAFAELDADTMATCYAPQATFRDEVFDLRGRDEVMGMWRMLCGNVRERGRDAWRLSFRDVQANDGGGGAVWEATYLFSATGRLVHNVIEARMRFDADGLIVEHHDRFDFWRWARQALGPAGMLLGWTPWLRAKVRAQAGANLGKFMARQTGTGGDG